MCPSALRTGIPAMGGGEGVAGFVGQHQPEEPGELLCVLAETLVEVPYLKEHQVVGMLLNQLEVLG